MAQEQGAMEVIVKLRVCFLASPFVELFDIWLDLEYFVCKADIRFGIGQYFMDLEGVLSKNGIYGDKELWNLKIHQLLLKGLSFANEESKMNFCVIVNISLTIRKIYSLRKFPRKSVENYYYHNAEKNSLFCQKQSLLVLVLFKFIAQEYGTEVPFEPLTPGMECWGCVCSSFPGELLVIPV